MKKFTSGFHSKKADMMEGFGERLKRACDSKFLSKQADDEAIGNDIQVGIFIKYHKCLLISIIF